MLQYLFVLSDGNDHFMVDGGGMTVLHQLKYAGLDWRQMRTIFVTHKHIDRLLGIIWMMRMISPAHAKVPTRAGGHLHAHDGVIACCGTWPGKLLQKRSCRSGRPPCPSLRWPTGKTILGGRPFLISAHQSQTVWFLHGAGQRRKADLQVTKPYNECEKNYAESTSTWLLHEAFCLHGQSGSLTIGNTTPP
ncbi:MAG: MBL fold metallo-hydrolase [Faecalibacterium sp.]